MMGFVCWDENPTNRLLPLCVFSMDKSDLNPDSCRYCDQGFRGLELLSRGCCEHTNVWLTKEHGQ